MYRGASVSQFSTPTEAQGLLMQRTTLTAETLRRFGHAMVQSKYRAQTDSFHKGIIGEVANGPSTLGSDNELKPFRAAYTKLLTGVRVYRLQIWDSCNE